MECSRCPSVVTRLLLPSTVALAPPTASPPSCAFAPHATHSCGMLIEPPGAARRIVVKPGLAAGVLAGTGGTFRASANPRSRRRWRRPSVSNTHVSSSRATFFRRTCSACPSSMRRRRRSGFTRARSSIRWCSPMKSTGRRRRRRARSSRPWKSGRSPRMGRRALCPIPFSSSPRRTRSSRSARTRCPNRSSTAS
jgi:hypothetical protein